MEKSQCTNTKLLLISGRLLSINVNDVVRHNCSSAKLENKCRYFFKYICYIKIYVRVKFNTTEMRQISRNRETTILLKLLKSGSHVPLYKFCYTLFRMLIYQSQSITAILLDISKFHRTVTQISYFSHFSTASDRLQFLYILLQAPRSHHDLKLLAIYPFHIDG